jgi:hypothetical protein
MSGQATVSAKADEPGPCSVIYETDQARRILLLQAAGREEVEAWVSGIFNVVLRCDKDKAKAIAAYALRLWRDYEVLRLRVLASVLEENRLEVPENILARVDWLQDEEVEVPWPFQFQLQQVSS